MISSLGFEKREGSKRDEARLSQGTTASQTPRTSCALHQTGTDPRVGDGFPTPQGKAIQLSWINGERATVRWNTLLDTGAVEAIRGSKTMTHAVGAKIVTVKGEGTSLGKSGEMIR